MHLCDEEIVKSCGIELKVGDEEVIIKFWDRHLPTSNHCEEDQNASSCSEIKVQSAMFRSGMLLHQKET